MVNAALNDGVITGNPMRGFKAAPYVNPERQYLTAEEIERVEKFASETTNETLKKVSTWFLFSVYSGLRYADVKKFDKKKIIEGRIFLRTSKSSTDVSIKLHPKLAAILDKISTGVFTNQKMNDYLKMVAEKCGINKNISFHTARHTFGVYFLNHGGSIEGLSKLLGHSSIKTTQIYGKIVNVRTDAEIDKVWSLKTG